jgi:hypothetical protein
MALRQTGAAQPLAISDIIGMAAPPPLAGEASNNPSDVAYDRCVTAVM